MTLVGHDFDAKLTNNPTVLIFAAGWLGSVSHIQQEGYSGKATTNESDCQQQKTEQRGNRGQEAGDSEHVYSTASGTYGGGDGCGKWLHVLWHVGFST